MHGKRRPQGQGLAELAARQHGVVSIRQLRGLLGYSYDAVERAAAAGRLHRLRQGVYAVGHRDLSRHGQCLAAVLGCGPRALLSHWSAAWLWGLMVTEPIPIHVTTPVSRRARSGLRIHRSRTLADADRALSEGIPVTSVARTSLDLAARVRRRSLDRLLRRGEDLGLFDLAEFESVLSRNKGHLGAASLGRAIALYRPPRFTRSGLEERFLELLDEAGIAAPVTGFVESGYELDVYWSDLRFAIELDVFETHGSRLSFEEDRLRQEELKLAGVEMIRVTGPRLEREPRLVLERVARLLKLRRRELAQAGELARSAVRRPRGGGR